VPGLVEHHRVDAMRPFQRLCAADQDAVLDQAGFEYLPGRFDCGCTQRDSVTVDKRETLHAYIRVAEENAVRLEEEVKFCRALSVDGIVSDITPFAFEVAVRPGFLRWRWPIYLVRYL
jgi:hypothetical protein